MTQRIKTECNVLVNKKMDHTKQHATSKPFNRRAVVFTAIGAAIVGGCAAILRNNTFSNKNPIRDVKYIRAHDPIRKDTQVMIPMDKVRWYAKYKDNIYVCAKESGCSLPTEVTHSQNDTWEVSKDVEPDTFANLNQHFRNESE